VHIHTQIIIHICIHTAAGSKTKATEKVVKIMQEVFDCVFEPFTYIHMHTYIHTHTHTHTATGSKSHRKGGSGHARGV
jgi:hypothetical protein